MDICPRGHIRVCLKRRSVVSLSVRTIERFSSMEEQPAYCWKDVGSIPTTSAVGWEGLKWSEKSVAYSNSKLEFSRKGATSLVGWEGLNGLKNRSHRAIQNLNIPERVRLVLLEKLLYVYVCMSVFFFRLINR